MVTSYLARSVRAAAVTAGLAVAVSACGSSPAAAPTTLPTTTVASTTTTTTTATTTAPTTAPVPTTAAAALPPAPQPSAEDAANALVGYWASGNRASALRVATSQAVTTLFAVAYPNGLAINRGCSSSFSPIICTFGAPGGGPTNAPIYQLDELQTTGGWYVNAVQIEG